MGAPTGSTVTRLTKPWRGYPSVNAVHGVRAHLQQDASKFVSSGLTPGVAPGGGQIGPFAASAAIFHIGTIPAGSLILPVAQHILVAFAPATTPVLDIGVLNAAGAFTAPGGILAAAALTTPGFTPSVATGTLLGFTAVELQLYARLTYTGGPPTAGEVDVLVPFYIQKD